MPRRRGMVAPINTVKHYVHHSASSVVGGTIVNDIVVQAVVAPATAASFEVKEGAVVKAIYVERWVTGSLADDPSQFTLVIEKKRNNEPNLTFAQSQNLGAYPNKKNILFTTQGLVGSETVGAPSIPLIRQWILVPKGKQRFGLADVFMVSIAFVLNGRRCGIDTFKEYI